MLVSIADKLARLFAQVIRMSSLLKCHLIANSLMKLGRHIFTHPGLLLEARRLCCLAKDVQVENEGGGALWDMF